jgi:hypothetical protein
MILLAEMCLFLYSAVSVSSLPLRPISLRDFELPVNVNGFAETVRPGFGSWMAQPLLSRLRVNGDDRELLLYQAASL